MTDIYFAAPPCPMCTRETVLKEKFRASTRDGYTCFFFCAPCGLQYPRFFEDGSAEQTAKPGV